MLSKMILAATIGGVMVTAAAPASAFGPGGLARDLRTNVAVRMAAETQTYAPQADDVGIGMPSIARGGLTASPVTVVIAAPQASAATGAHAGFTFAYSL